MHVRSLLLEHVLNHERSLLELPERGVVVVTGENGQGKSAIIEGVAAAGWGKTLRGSPPWQTGAKACAAVLTLADGLRIERRRKGSKTELGFAYEGTEPEKFETATKAQDALDRVIRTFDVWRRSHAFSSSDAAHFTLASDGDRKRLLEDILGLDRFDPALEACRQDLRAATRDADAATHAREVLVARLLAERRRCDDARAGLEALGARPAVPAAPPDCPAVSASRTGALLAAVERDVAAARSKARSLTAADGGAAADLRAAEALLAQLSGRDCPTCEQGIPDALRARVRGRAEVARAEVEAARSRAQAARKAVEDELEELEADAAALRARVERESADALLRSSDARHYADAVASAARYDRQLAQLTGVVQSATAEVDRLTSQVAQAEAAERSADVALKLLIACERVLGLRGVRAQLLGRALNGLESVTNSWLSRLPLRGRTLRIELDSFSEKKTGGVIDSISLKVVGAGGDCGYRATSGGERRRVDLAVMLGLAEVASAAYASARGTLWFDEVFDALDPEGIDAVVGVIAQLAEDRAVVVITHSPPLAARLPAAVRIRVAAGRAVAAHQRIEE